MILVIFFVLDYGRKRFPSVACVCDFVRCSVTFETSKELYNGLNSFINKVNLGETGCITKICRIKNGLKDIKNWKNEIDATYCDIKLNVIITSKNGSEKRAIIGEIQLLLQWMLEAKKKGHKMYSFMRRKEYIETVSQRLIEMNGNINKLNESVNEIVVSGNLKGLGKQLFYLPNLIICSMFDENEKGINLPLLYKIGKNDDTLQLFELFMAFLFHFGNNIGDPSYIGKYLNYNECNNGIISKTLLSAA